jgi:hypothetical protein
VQRIERWLESPSSENSALPAHAIERWGVMPALQLSGDKRRAVARYVVTLATTMQHEPGTPGMGMQQRMGHGARDMPHGGGMGMQHRHGQAQDVPADTTAAIVRAGEPAAAALRTGLMRRLSAALQAGPAEGAIRVCAVEALPLTDSIARATGVQLKRTSERIRNPLNAPDALEQSALSWFAAEQRAGHAPSQLVQRDGASFRYYAPLRIAAPCLNCHGAVESLTPAVRSALEQRYPNDRATGYAEGDLRGLIRVTVPAAGL